MDKIKITLPDGKVMEEEKGISAQEIALKIGPGLENAALAARINGEVTDLTTPITTDTKLEIITFKDKIGKEIFWHSASHVLAKAAKKLYPDLKLTIGPAIDDGFYYDFDTKKPLTNEDLEKIEEEMKNIVNEGIVFERIDDVDKNKAKDLQKGEPYKLEMIDELGDEAVSLYKNGEFVDLCKGPHVPHTGKIKAFKLTKLAGAYWKGSVNNKQLQRVYGVAFPDKKELKKYLRLLEEAKERDHRKIGKELSLFSLHNEGPGFVFFHPKGTVLFNNLLDFWRQEHKRENYVEIKTPIILSRELWETSGHWANYRENMYTTKIDDMDFAIKPMNCPGGMLFYKEKLHSYRDLPYRVGEIGLVHRHELSGTLGGLFRVRCFHQDDAHIFMRPSQISSEIKSLLNLIDRIYSIFGLTYHMELSTRPEKSIGTDEQWETATNGLKSALESSGKEYVINEGDGAFYGPKIDFHITDCLGRTWQCGTVQLDMSLPERFDLTYDDKDNQKKRPVMIHRVIYGSIERFLGILVEHYAGKFPLWLNPVQVRILTVADRFNDYANEVKKQMEAEGLRVEVDSTSESISKKVRTAQLSKVNYILVVGEKEVNEKTVTVRTRDNEVIGAQKVEEFIEKLLKEVKAVLG
jgi:threonyl-tRNA synthetase